MIQDLQFIFWFFLPAGIANMAPVFAAKFPFLEKFSYPVDFYKTFRGKRILGDHKTIRGFISGIILGILGASIQYFLNPKFFAALPANPFILGFLLSLGALTGDAIKSFFKRQSNIPHGKDRLPNYQIDYILGAIVFTFFYSKLSWYFYFLGVILYFLLHIVVTVFGYLVALKDEPV